MTIGLGPDNLNQLIPSQVCQASSYNLRNYEDYLTVHTSTQMYYNSLVPSVMTEWYNLPQSSRNVATLESFKLSLNKDTFKRLSYYCIGEMLVQI